MKKKIADFIEWIRKFVRDKFNSRNEELPYYITITIAIILFAVGLKVFIELTDELAENELEPYDTYVTNFVVSFRNSGLTSFFQFVTNLGDRYTYILVTLGLGVFFFIRVKNLKFTLQIITVLILASLSNIALKRIINRARPSLEHLVSVNTLSFPSGHSMSAMAFYGFLIYLCLRFKLNLLLRIVVITLLTVLILSIGLSRIYLGVHYPSDVAAGFVGGILWIALCAIVFNVIDLQRKRKQAKSVSSIEPVQ
jgi:undecaprenyl-diphosphatase